jgi:hypothetical protein
VYSIPRCPHAGQVLPNFPAAYKMFRTPALLTTLSWLCDRKYNYTEHKQNLSKHMQQVLKQQPPSQRMDPSFTRSGTTLYKKCWFSLTVTVQCVLCVFCHFGKARLIFFLSLIDLNTWHTTDNTNCFARLMSKTLEIYDAHFLMANCKHKTNHTSKLK